MSKISGEIKYRKKPVEVGAFQISLADFADAVSGALLDYAEMCRRLTDEHD